MRKTAKIITILHPKIALGEEGVGGHVFGNFLAADPSRNLNTAEEIVQLMWQECNPRSLHPGVHHGTIQPPGHHGKPDPSKKRHGFMVPRAHSKRSARYAQKIALFPPRPTYQGFSRIEVTSVLRHHGSLKSGSRKSNVCRVSRISSALRQDSVSTSHFPSQLHRLGCRSPALVDTSPISIVKGW